MRAFLWTLSLLALAAAGAGAAPAPRSAAKAAGAVTFEAHVMPVLRANCVGCHNARMAQAGVMLDTLAAALKGPTKGPVIVPGKSKASALVAMISGPTPKMPPAAS